MSTKILDLKQYPQIDPVSFLKQYYIDHGTAC